MPETKPRIILTHQQPAMEVEMVGQARWAEIHRLHEEDGQSISAIAMAWSIGSDQLSLTEAIDNKQTVSKKPCCSTLRLCFSNVKTGL